MGNIGGPINKKASFFFDVQRRNIDEIAVVNAPALTTRPEPFQLTEAFPTRVPAPTSLRVSTTKSAPTTRSPLATSITVTHRRTPGSAGWRCRRPATTPCPPNTPCRSRDTQVLSTKAINETRFQYLRDNSDQNPVTTPLQQLPPGFTTNGSINVLGAFSGGGASSGTQTDHQDHYELQNYTSISQGNHFREIRRATASSSRSQYFRRRI